MPPCHRNSTPPAPAKSAPPRRITLAFLAAATILAAPYPTRASGIPVVDAASLLDRAIKHMETMTKFVTQISLLKDQVEHQRRQLEALTGSRGLGDILSNPLIRDLLPSDARHALRSGEDLHDTLSDAMEQVKRAERLTGNYTQDRDALTRRTREHAYRRQVLMDQVQRATTARMNQIDQLQHRINRAQDPKAIADLQARLMVEQANIQADQIRADTLTRQLDAEEKLVAQQEDALAESGFSLRAIHAPISGAR